MSDNLSTLKLVLKHLFRPARLQSSVKRGNHRMIGMTEVSKLVYLE